jgi:predicted metal-dependent TIM-barrel fold hydrolase
MNEFPVNATVDEWNVLIGLLDSVTKSEGLKVALAVGVWDRKIKDSAEAAAKAEHEAINNQSTVVDAVEPPKLLVEETPKEE